MVFYIVGGLLVTLGIRLFFVGQRKSKLLATMTVLETSDIGSLAADRHVEVKGVASCTEPQQAPAVNVDCVYYKYKVDRREVQ